MKKNPFPTQYKYNATQGLGAKTKIIMNVLGDFWGIFPENLDFLHQKTRFG